MPGFIYLDADRPVFVPGGVIVRSTDHDNDSSSKDNITTYVRGYPGLLRTDVPSLLHVSSKGIRLRTFDSWMGFAFARVEMLISLCSIYLRSTNPHPLAVAIAPTSKMHPELMV
jgi:hypothetical protein